MDRNYCAVKFHDEKGVSAVVVAKRHDGNTIMLGASFFKPKDRAEGIQPTVKEGIRIALDRVDNDPVIVKWDTRRETTAAWDALTRNKYPTHEVEEALSAKYGNSVVESRIMYAY